MAQRRLTGNTRLAAALALVLLGHWAGGRWLQQLDRDWRPIAPMPPPLQVSFTQAMRPKAPSAAPRPLRRLKTPAAAGSRLAVEPPVAVDIDVDTATDGTLDPLPDRAAIEPPPEPGPEWPLSTRLSYGLSGNYRGPVSGFSTVEWLRQGAHYQVRIEVAVGPRAAPLMSRRMSSDGRLTPRGIAPLRFDEDTRLFIAPRQRRTIAFEDGAVTLADGRREPTLAGVQDASSQFVQLTWLFLTGRLQARPGLLVELPLALPRRQYLWGYRVLGEETLQTPLGPLAAWHLRPTVRPANGDLVAEVWLAPALQYLPVRLLIRESAENFVDLLLDEVPLQEAPIVRPSPETPESTP